MSIDRCPHCGMKKEARRIKSKEGRSWCTGCKALERKKAKQQLEATVVCRTAPKMPHDHVRSSFADRQEMIHRSPAKRQKRKEVEEASEVYSMVASTIDTSRSVMPVSDSMSVARPNLN